MCDWVQNFVTSFQYQEEGALAVVFIVFWPKLYKKFSQAQPEYLIQINLSVT